MGRTSSKVMGLTLAVALVTTLIAANVLSPGAPNSGARDVAESAGESPASVAAAAAPAALPIVSRGVPAYASQLWWGCSKGCYLSPDNAVDADYSTKFSTVDAATPATPQWLALDLNGKGLGAAHVVIYTGGASDYYYNTAPGHGAITDFSLQGATGGAGTAPTSWTTLTRLGGQRLSSFTLLVDLTPYSWLRVLVTGNSFAPPPGSPGVVMQVDVRDARNGVSDSFKFFGDSITADCMSAGAGVSFSTLVNAGSSSNFPAFQNAGIGGWSASYLLQRFDEWLANYPGRYVGISMGTNDANGDLSGRNAATFYSHMLTMVDKALAAGKVPIVPTIPWAALPQYRDAIPHYNTKIGELYAARPEVVRGPDLWAYFQSNPIYVTSGDGLHPTTAGCVQMRQLWANAALSGIYGAIPASLPVGPVTTATPTAAPR